MGICFLRGHRSDFVAEAGVLPFHGPVLPPNRTSDKIPHPRTSEKDPEQFLEVDAVPKKVTKSTTGWR